jgi:hypothetical protein
MQGRVTANSYTLPSLFDPSLRCKKYFDLVCGCLKGSNSQFTQVDKLNKWNIWIHFSYFNNNNELSKRFLVINFYSIHCQTHDKVHTLVKSMPSFSLDNKWRMRLLCSSMFSLSKEYSWSSFISSSTSSSNGVSIVYITDRK